MRTSIGILPRLSGTEPPTRSDDGLVEFGRSEGPVACSSNESPGMRNLVDLASRRGGGIEVALIWNRKQGTLVVFAHDDRTDEEVSIPVSSEEASEVYRHPFAYAHRSLAVGSSVQVSGRAAARTP